MRTALDVLNGIPSIVIGIFVFALLVVEFRQNAFIASIALAIIMLPLVSRSTQEVLALVPQSLREASQALGVSKWRTVLGVVLPTTFGGILTGTTLAIARAAGETAPLLFTSTLFTNTISADPRHAVNTVPFTIFTYSESPDPNLQRPGLGGGVRPDHVRARHEPDRALPPASQPREAHPSLRSSPARYQPFTGFLPTWTGAAPTLAAKPLNGRRRPP